MKVKFTAFLLLPQLLFVILFGIFVDYDDFASGPQPKETEADSTEFNRLYPMFQDVHVMIFIGFGFLMTFLKRYGYGSIGFNFMLAVFVLQWAILLRGFFDRDGFADGKINLTLDNFLNGDFASAAVLISFGAVLGVLSPVQLIVMAFLEVVFYTLNEFIIISLFKISDIGGSLVIHAFGAYFGLAVATLHWRKELQGNPKEGSVYNSDIFAMIGTLFLWLYWPSFNASPAAGTMMGERAVITTVLSLSAATVAAFALSAVLEKNGKLSMVHIQNATIAGGVAAGSVANLRLGPTGSIVVGACAGMLAVAGYKFITPTLQKSFNLHDTCGVHNLHGMPGILSALVAIVLARYSTMNTFTTKELHVIYPASEEEGFDFHYQAKMQLAGLAVTLALSIVGGLFTGAILKIPFFDKTRTQSLFDDEDYWILENSEEMEVAGGNGMDEMNLMKSTSSRNEGEERKSLVEEQYDQTPISQDTALLTTES